MSIYINSVVVHVELFKESTKKCLEIHLWVLQGYNMNRNILNVVPFKIIQKQLGGNLTEHMQDLEAGNDKTLEK